MESDTQIRILRRLNCNIDPALAELAIEVFQATSTAKQMKRFEGSPNPSQFAITVAQFHRLMFSKWYGDGSSDSSICLQRSDLDHFIYGCLPPYQ